MKKDDRLLYVFKQKTKGEMEKIPPDNYVGIFWLYDTNNNNFMGC